MKTIRWSTTYASSWSALAPSFRETLGLYQLHVKVNGYGDRNLALIEGILVRRLVVKCLDMDFVLCCALGRFEDCVV